MPLHELDFLLSIGYFRMQQDVFTCRYVQFDGAIHPVYWLRIVLSVVNFGPKQSRLFRINAPYTVTVRPFVLTDEVEMLYAQYRSNINFDTYSTVESCLWNGADTSKFDTYNVQIRDDGKLIAVGIFDNAGQSIAGIMNFYDPDYHRQSLGKYLMLLKTEYARQRGLAYYYPGYIVGNYPKFDFKLFTCEAATEVFDEPCVRWLPFSWETVKVLEND
ncbi:MAG: arginyl-tRNA--protein transferase [Rudanella sp.]|nr:arginyl-tRNA--protein transferase [Rudanella sp.]